MLGLNVFGRCVLKCMSGITKYVCFHLFHSILNHFALSNWYRPDPSVVRQNQMLLYATFLHETCADDLDDLEECESPSLASRKDAADYLLRMDSGEWGNDEIIHHCAGLSCCDSPTQTKIKLWIAIQASLFWSGGGCLHWYTHSVVKLEHNDNEPMVRGVLMKPHLVIKLLTNMFKCMRRQWLSTADLPRQQWVVGLLVWRARGCYCYSIFDYIAFNISWHVFQKLRRTKSSRNNNSHDQLCLGCKWGYTGSCSEGSHRSTTTNSQVCNSMNVWVWIQS